MSNSIKKVIGQIPWMVISLFIVAIPCVWAGNSMLDASLLPRQLLLAICLLLLVLVFVFYISKGLRFSFGRAEMVVFGGLSLFLLVNIVACINAINIHEALFHIVKEFMFGLWFFLVYQLLKTAPSGREHLIKAVTAASAIFIGIAIVQLVKSDFESYRTAVDHRSFYLNRIMEHIYSTCSNKNLFASLLFVTLPFDVYNIVSFKRHNIESVIWLVVGVVVAVTNLGLIVLLLSRTIFGALALSAMVAVVTIYIYILRIRPRQTMQPMGAKLKLAMILAPFAVIIVVAAITGLTETQIEKTVKERIILTVNPQKYDYRDNEHGESSVAMRKIIWSKTIDMMKEHPLIGVGPGQWQILIPKFGVDEFGEQLREGSQTFQRPHNDYLWFAAESGLIGLLGYLVFFLGIIAVGFANIKQQCGRNALIFSVLGVSFLIGWILVSMLDYPHERIEHNIFMLAVCAIILADHTQNKPSTINNKHANKLTFGILGLATVTAIVGFEQTLQFCKGESNAREVLSYYYGGGWKKVIQLTRQADRQPYTVNNFTSPILFYRGSSMSMVGNDQVAIEEFKKALKMAPYHILTLNACGTSYLKLKQYDEAEKMYQQTLSISPRNYNALFDLAIIHYNKKDFGKAFEYISKIPFKINKKPDNFEKTYITITRLAVFEKRDLYNSTKLNAWINDEQRVWASIKKSQTDNCSLEEILMKEVGAK